MGTVSGHVAKHWFGMQNEGGLNMTEADTASLPLAVCQGDFAIGCISLPLQHLQLLDLLHPYGVSSRPRIRSSGCLKADRVLLVASWKQVYSSSLERPTTSRSGIPCDIS